MRSTLTVVLLHRAIAPVCALLLTAPAAAQCGIDWLLNGGLPGVNAPAYLAAGWDPDGSGPGPEVVVVGGLFTVAGTANVGRIAVYSPTNNTWSGLGSGFEDGAVYDACALPGGGLVVSGSFTTLVGGALAYSIAHWNGTQWSPMGGGVNGFVPGIARLPNGDIVAAGTFSHAGGLYVNRVAVYHFATGTWTGLGAGLPHPAEKVIVQPNGDIVVAVRVIFTNEYQLLRWNGVTWTQIASLIGGPVLSMFNLPGGDLGIAGGFLTIGGASLSYLAKWDGTNWAAYGTAPNQPATQGRAAVLADGSLVFAGLGYIRRWDGVAWLPLGTGLNWAPTSVTGLASGDVVVAGQITLAGGVPVLEVARWDGANWSAMGGGGPTQAVRAFTVLPNGHLIAGGEFIAAGGLTVNHVAEWDGTAWHPLGTGMNGWVNTLLALPNGDVIAGGAFTTAGGTAAGRIARWNGASWQPLGTGFDNEVRALACLPNGAIVAGGSFQSAGGVGVNRVAQWSGSAWGPLGAGCNETVLALAVLANGDLVAGGAFFYAGGAPAGRIARWNGSSWSPLGSGIAGNPVFTLHVRPDGDLIAGGSFTVAGGVGAMSIARWNGSAWSPVGNGLSGSVSALATLHNGDLVAAGNFVNAGSAGTNNLARWTGGAWLSFGPSPDSGVSALAALADNQLAVGGGFQQAGGGASPYFARLTTQCPATASSYGSGCPGSAGPVALAIDTLPWIGGAFRVTATGLPVQSLAVGVGGLHPLAIPLASILPQAALGCDLLASTEALYLLVPTAGQVHAVIPIPLSVPYIGKDFYFQIVAFEFDATWSIIDATSSAALALSVGSF